MKTGNIRVNVWTVCRNENKVVAVSGGSTVISFTPAVTMFFLYLAFSFSPLCAGYFQVVTKAYCVTMDPMNKASA